MPWVALRISDWFVRYRSVLTFMGRLPERLIVHSRRSEIWMELLTRDEDKRDKFPLVVMPLEDTDLPKDRAEKNALRQRLGLPEDRFVFVSPGFFFARKRYKEVIRALPDDAMLVLTGTKSEWEPRYFDEVMELARDKPNVIINTDYDTMGDYVAASDAVVLYYENVFQSAVVTQAVWAGLPCILSDAEGFAPYHGAGVVVRDTGELADAMREIQEPETYASIVRSVGTLRDCCPPSATRSDTSPASRSRGSFSSSSATARRSSADPRVTRAPRHRLARSHVEVATTTALDYWTWTNHYPSGDDARRHHRAPLPPACGARISKTSRSTSWPRRTRSRKSSTSSARRARTRRASSTIHDHGREYDAVLFYTYIYEPTALGLPIVPERAALISTAHDEGRDRPRAYRALFQLPRAFGFLTREERDMVHARFGNEHIPSEVLGIGMDPAPDYDDSYRRRYGDGPLVAYLGQVSEGKGVDELLVCGTSTARAAAAARSRSPARRAWPFRSATTSSRWGG